MELWGNGNPSGFDPENEGSTPSGSAHSGASRFFNATKGGTSVDGCKHERIKSVNCVIYCDICGAKLPIDYLVGKDRIAEQNAAKPAEKPQETKPNEAPKEPKEPKKRTTKKGAK